MRGLNQNADGVHSRLSPIACRLWPNRLSPVACGRSPIAYRLSPVACGLQVALRDSLRLEAWAAAEKKALAEVFEARRVAALEEREAILEAAAAEVSEGLHDQSASGVVQNQDGGGGGWEVGWAAGGMSMAGGASGGAGGAGGGGETGGRGGGWGADTAATAVTAAGALTARSTAGGGETTARSTGVGGGVASPRSPKTPKTSRESGGGATSGGDWLAMRSPSSVEPLSPKTPVADQSGGGGGGALARMNSTALSATALAPSTAGSATAVLSPGSPGSHGGFESTSASRPLPPSRAFFSYGVVIVLVSHASCVCVCASCICTPLQLLV